MAAGAADLADDERINPDPADFDLDWIHSALSERSHWAHGRGRSVAEVSSMGSLGFATVAWTCDVFVGESVSGRGVGKG